MRRFISILFLSLMLLQAIPVLHFFSAQKEVFYTYIDEEKPDEKGAKEKKVAKEYLTIEMDVAVPALVQTIFFPAIDKPYASPTLVFLTPPPDVC